MGFYRTFQSTFEIPEIVSEPLEGSCESPKITCGIPEGLLGISKGIGNIREYL